MRHTFERLFEQADVTCEVLAQRTGLPIERVEAILSGRWLPSPAERNKLASALELQPDEIDWGHTMSPRNVRYHRFGFPKGNTEETQ